MVLALEPRLILLDEPTAGLTKAERATIGTVLRQLTAEAGYAIMLVEHDLDFVREISSRIVVLHQGRLVLDGTVEDVVDSETGADDLRRRRPCMRGARPKCSVCARYQVATARSRW